MNRIRIKNFHRKLRPFFDSFLESWRANFKNYTQNFLSTAVNDSAVDYLKAFFKLVKIERKKQLLIHSSLQLLSVMRSEQQYLQLLVEYGLVVHVDYSVLEVFHLSLDCGHELHHSAGGDPLVMHHHKTSPLLNSTTSPLPNWKGIMDSMAAYLEYAYKVH